MLSRLLPTMACLFLTGIWTSAQEVPPGGPLVLMTVTPPGGQPAELSTRESGLATVEAAGRTYGFRPTMHDDQGHRITVTVFDMGSASDVVREIGSVELQGGGAPVASNTTPQFRVAARTREGVAGTSGTAPAVPR